MRKQNKLNVWSKQRRFIKRNPTLNRFLVLLIISILTSIIFYDATRFAPFASGFNNVQFPDSKLKNVPTQTSQATGQGSVRVGVASWLQYELFDSCATRDYPKGTELEVRMEGATEPTITCVVRDFGPDASVFPERIIDLNYDQFAILASPEVGIINVEVKQL